MKQDLDTITNVILNNQYKLHEDDKNTSEKNINKKIDDDERRKLKNNNLNNENMSSKRRKNENIELREKNHYENRNSVSKNFDENGNYIKRRHIDEYETENELDDYEIESMPYSSKRATNKKGKHLKENERVKHNTNDKVKNSNTKIDTNKKIDSNSNVKQNKKSHKKKKTFKQRILKFFRVIIILAILFAIFLYLFFKTSLFEKYKDLWVETAMTTLNHQYLAKWFLSDDEIQKILDKSKVENNEDSNSNDISINSKTKDDINVEKISGKNYVGYVMTVSDASKVSLVDGRKSTRGSKLSEIVKEHNAVAGINAGGFADEGGVGAGNVLNNATIMNKKLLKGNKSSKYSFIGLSEDKKLILGNYTYNEALRAGIESAIQFGPFLIVNGNNQIKNSTSGGIQPRMAIGQKKDGTFVFVVVDGRQPGYSIGTNLLELQNIFNRYDVYNAANLDGGSSATMYYNGKVINKTSTPMGERYLPNAFIVSK